MMGCNCGKSRAKVAITSAEATAMLASGPPKYKVTDGNGESKTFDLYIDAKVEAVKTGGTLTEQR